jgi:hypothetical protein
MNSILKMDGRNYRDGLDCKIFSNLPISDVFNLASKDVSLLTPWAANHTQIVERGL